MCNRGFDTTREAKSKEKERRACVGNSSFG